MAGQEFIAGPRPQVRDVGGHGKMIYDNDIKLIQTPVSNTHSMIHRQTC